MPATHTNDSLQVQSLAGDELGLLGADAPGQTTGTHSDLAATLQASQELLQTDSALGREQANYLRQVLQMPPEELAQNLQQLQAVQAQLAFQRQKNLNLSEQLRNEQMQWQGLSAGLALLCLLLLLWMWRGARRKRQGQPAWHQSQSAVPSHADAHASQAASDDEHAEGGEYEQTQARVSEIWADSQDWLDEDSIKPAAAFRPSEPAALASSAEPHGRSFLASNASNTAAQPRSAWMAWGADAQPQPGQPLVDYLRSLRRMVLRLMDAGRLADARSLLYAHIRLMPATSPWAYMAYFALQTNNSPEQEEIASQFAAQFERAAPVPSEYQYGGGLQRSLLDYQYSLSQLSQAWPSERAVLLLESWLAPHKRRSFSLQAYDDLFVLYDVLDQLHGIPIHRSHKKPSA